MDYITKMFHNVHSDVIYERNVNENVIPPPQNTTKSKNLIEAAKKAMKRSVQGETLLHWNLVVHRLTFQGDFLKLLIEEKSNLT